MNREDLLSSKGSSKTNQICQFKSWNTAVEQLITKHRGVLQINSELKKVFEERSIIAFKRNKNIQNTIG